jgi:hypothetical protein
MHLFRAPLLAALLGWLVAGCSYPSDKAILSFAYSTTASTSIASSATDLQGDIDDKTQAILAATEFAVGSKAAFPPPQGQYNVITSSLPFL